MASAPGPQAKEQSWTSKDRPWLVQWNRKLRHLNRILVRNLVVAHDAGHERTKSADDEALPNALKSPAKLLALREARTLEHSRSSSDLRPIHESAIDSSGYVANGRPRAGSKAGKVRPGMPKLRRRSTLDWSASNPEQRQKKLEDVYDNRMADVLFTIHVDGVDDPIYVSEIAERTMNPTFKHMNLGDCGPAIARNDSLKIKIWISRGSQEGYHILVDMSLCLRSLQFLGKDLAAFTHPFPRNCVIFELVDGFYTCFTDAQVAEPINPFTTSPARSSSSRALPTSSFDALLRLSKLDDSIQDALAFQQKLMSDLEKLVHQRAKFVKDQSQVYSDQDFSKTIDYAKGTVGKQLKALSRTLDAKKKGLRDRRDRLEDSRRNRVEGTTEINSGQPGIAKNRTNIENLCASISQQRRRICEDVQTIYRISPVKDRSLAFAIRGLHLPNSEDLDSVAPEVLAAALGHVTHVIQLLSFYLDQPLPYAVKSRSSTSTVSDHISIIQSGAAHSTMPAAIAKSNETSRTFPLFSRSGPKFRFQYGLFLLNKDIELLLANAFRVRILDIRQTLPNLLYALYCATAGEGELPARKAGGVRGLLRSGKGGGASMPTTSRTTSSDSSTLNGSFTNASAKKNGRQASGSAYDSLAKNQADQG